MIGQRNLTSRLGSLVRLKKLPRFIVLVGELGSGRRTITQWVAQEMGARFIEVNRAVEDIRNVVTQCYEVPDVTLYFIPDGDLMSAPAKSALLKVTEEPPMNAYFVISTVDADMLSPALVSRANVYHMDSYSMADISAFLNDPSADIQLYSNCCNNGREVNLVKQWGTDFFNFVTLVMDNIDVVSSSNAFKMENKIAFTDDAEGYDVKIFLQAFYAECMRRIRGMGNDTSKRTLRDQYIAWIQITSDKLKNMQIRAIDKRNVFDTWIFEIREVSRSAEG